MTNPNSRFKVHKVDGSTFIVADSTTGNEICTVSDYETADGDWTNDAENRAMTIAVVLNQSAWDYRPSFGQ
jgi:hypothetical protein